MKKIFAAAALALLALPADAQVFPEVIYGKDNRLDLYQVKESQVLELADSTLALFPANAIDMTAEKARLSTKHYGEDMELCKEEPFYDQYTGAFCSGSLVAPDVIMTAGHCVTTQSDCEETKFVFGFAVKDSSVKNPNEVPASEVYGCQKLLGREQADSGVDWALVKLDRRVTNHKPLKVNSEDSPKKGTPLVVVGHPAGLPTKVAGGAKVRDASPKGYFVANLDTYGGNSGSAVFNAKTGLIEGILVRGENDFVWKDGCRVSQVCDNRECRGEDVTKIAVVPLPRSGEQPQPVMTRVAPLGENLGRAIENLTPVTVETSFDQR